MKPTNKSLQAFMEKHKEWLKLDALPQKGSITFNSDKSFVVSGENVDPPIAKVMGHHARQVYALLRPLFAKKMPTTKATFIIQFCDGKVCGSQAIYQVKPLGIR